MLITLLPLTITAAIILHELRVRTQSDFGVALGIGAAFASFLLLVLFAILVLVPIFEILASFVRTRMR
jgi:hypothetical protein